MKVNNMTSGRAFLEQMPTQELDEILKAELHKENIDDDLVRMILCVLEEREADYPMEDNAEVAAAVEKYTAYIESVEAAPAKTVRKWNSVLKVASLLLMVGLLIFVAPQAANAESFFEMLARWTDSVFEFFRPGDENEQPEYVFETDHPGLQQIYDAVVELGVTDPVVPMWVPDGYELIECKTINSLQEKTVHAIFNRGKDTLTFRVTIVDSMSEVSTYKDESNVITYEYNDCVFYITNNIERQIAIWDADNMVCSVAVDCQEDVIFEILKTIYQTEE